MTAWRGYFIVGILLGGTLAIIGIYTESMPLRLVGIALPLVSLAIGVAVDRQQRKRHDRR